MTGGWCDIDPDAVRKFSEAMAQAQCNGMAAPWGFSADGVHPQGGAEPQKIHLSGMADRLNWWLLPDDFSTEVLRAGADFRRQQQAQDAPYTGGPLVVDTEAARLRQELDEARKRIAHLEEVNADIVRTCQEQFTSLSAAMSLLRERFPDWEFLPGEDINAAMDRLVVHARKAAAEANPEPLAREPKEPSYPAGSWRWGMRRR